jgi:hypothetical protein
MSLDKFKIEIKELYPEIFFYLNRFILKYFKNNKIDEFMDFCVLTQDSYDKIIKLVNSINPNIINHVHHYIQCKMLNDMDDAEFVNIIKEVNNRFNEVLKVKKIYPNIDKIDKLINEFVDNYIFTGSLIDTYYYFGFKEIEYDSIETYIKSIYLRHQRISKRLEIYNINKTKIMKNKSSRNIFFDYVQHRSNNSKNIAKKINNLINS